MLLLGEKKKRGVQEGEVKSFLPGWTLADNCVSVFVRWCLRAFMSASVSACVMYVMYVMFVMCAVYVMSSCRSLLLDNLYTYRYM